MKYCSYCGAGIPDAAAFCTACGKAVEAPVARPTAQPARQPVAYGQPTVVPPQPLQYAAQPAQRSDDVFAVLSFAAGLAGIVLLAVLSLVPLSYGMSLVVGLLLAGNDIMGILLSCKARDARRRGLAVAGKILSIVALALCGTFLMPVALELLGRSIPYPGGGEYAT